MTDVPASDVTQALKARQIKLLERIKKAGINLDLNENQTDSKVENNTENLPDDSERLKQTETKPNTKKTEAFTGSRLLSTQSTNDRVTKSTLESGRKTLDVLDDVRPCIGDEPISPLTKSLLFTMAKNQKAIRSFLCGSMGASNIPSQVVQDAFVSMQQAVDEYANDFAREATVAAREWFEFSKNHDEEMEKLRETWDREATEIRDKIQASKETALEAQRQMDSQGSEGSTQIKLMKTKLETLMETKEELENKIKNVTRRKENIDNTLMRNAQESQRSLMNEYARSIVSNQMEIEKLRESISAVNNETKAIQSRALEVIESANDNLVRQEDKIATLTEERNRMSALVKGEASTYDGLISSYRLMARERVKLIDDIDSRKQEIERVDRVLLMVQNGEIMPGDVIPKRSTLSKYSSYIHPVTPQTNGGGMGGGMNNEGNKRSGTNTRRFTGSFAQSELDTSAQNSLAGTLSFGRGGSGEQSGVARGSSTRTIGSPSKSSKMMSSIDKACFDMNLNKRIDSILDLPNDEVIDNSAVEQGESLVGREYTRRLTQYLKNISKIDESLGHE